MDCDIVIVGAGVIGLAAASKVAGPNTSVFVLEQYKAFGQETSSRNSEVIHAGIYYPKDSLKAKLCVEGAERLYQLCSEHNIPHNRLGKLILAVKDEEIPSLETLKARADGNGVKDLEILESATIRQLEPNVYAKAALFSPNTGVIDSHQLMKYFETKALANEASIVYGCRVTAATPINDGYRLSVEDADGPSDISTRMVINCAGLQSDQLAAMVGIDIQNHQYKIHFCKGEYFGVNPPKGKLVERLIYPSPMEELSGLGIHATKDLGGRLKLGPNAYYVDEINYQVDTNHRDDFLDSAKALLPFLEKEDLFPDMAGIRPKLQGPHDPVRDFVICHEQEKGFPGWINLVGIESPGLTASPAIAELVAQLVDEYL